MRLEPSELERAAVKFYYDVFDISECPADKLRENLEKIIVLRDAAMEKARKVNFDFEEAKARA